MELAYVNFYNKSMKSKFHRYLNLVVGIIIIVQWVRMVLGFSGTTLTASGLRSLKYFTVLSNLLEALACFMFFFNGNEKLKYPAAVAVGLTFLVVMVFLGPMFGYPFMFIGANLWFHGLVPLYAMIEFVICNRVKKNHRDNLYATLSMVIYGTGYLGNILINGMGEWPNRNDWYGFMNWGYPVGIIIFLVIIGITYMIGFVLRKLNMKVGVRNDT